MKLSVILLAIPSFAAFSSSLYAGVPAASGDLILGFQATGGMGADTNLEVNLGPASAFYGAPAGSASVLTRLSAVDLANIYGNDWNTRPDLFWGVIGTTGVAAVSGVPARTVWASRPETTPGTPSLGWPRAGTFTLQIPSNTIASLYTGAPGSIDRPEAIVTANSAFSAKVSAAESGSWKAQEGAIAGVSFKYFNPSVMNAVATFPAANSSYDGTAYTVLDLWEVRPGSAADQSTLVGGIGINNAGKLVFSRDVTKFGPSTGPMQLGIPTIAYDGITATVTLADVSPGSYILERSTTMAESNWPDLLTQSPVSGTLVYVDTNPPVGRAFYRIHPAP